MILRNWQCLLIPVWVFFSNSILLAQPCQPSTPGIVINEIHYNPPSANDPGDWLELYNPTAGTVDLSGWQLQDESGSYSIPFGTTLGPDSYLVLVQNTLTFGIIYPLITNRIGPLGFGFSGAGEMVKLRSDAGCVVDSLEYDDKYPWPADADGNGPSIELIYHTMDNGLPGSWLASAVYNGTPGEVNSINSDPCDPLPPSLIINEIFYDAPYIADAGEWVEIYNPNAFLVNLEGWKLSDGGTSFVFPAGAQIPALGYFVAIKDSSLFASQHPAVTNYVGSFTLTLGNNGDQVILLSPTGCAVDGVIYEDGGEWPKAADGNGPSLSLINTGLDNGIPSNWAASADGGGTPGSVNTVNLDACSPQPPNLIINEINYLSDTLVANAGDWIEIRNPNASPVDVSLWQIQSETGKYFFPSGTQIPANGFLVIVEDSSLFSAIHPAVSNFIGHLAFPLKNSGELLKLYTEAYCRIDEVEYNDLPPWPIAANGFGYSLSLADTASENDLPHYWGHSAVSAGSPGQANLLATPCVVPFDTLVINEINYNSSPGFDPGDWIELYNPNNFSIDLSGWILIDQSGGFRFPPGTTIGADDYFVAVEDSTMFSTIFPTVSAYVGQLGFTLKGSGERIILFSPDFCEMDQVDYDDLAPWPLGPAGNGPTLSLTDHTLDNSKPGSWKPSTGTGGTPGQPNTWSEPCAFPPANIVINEINYNSDAEFDPTNWLELYNPDPMTADLSGWEIHTDSGAYTIPFGTTLGSDGYLVLAENSVVFSFQFPGVSNYQGPTHLGFDNAGERILLYNLSYCLVDSVRYNDKAPWPELPDGEGPSLSLIHDSLDNALGQHWFAGPGNGTPGRKNLADPCAPGGIDKDLELWIRADDCAGIDGLPLSTWQDHSPNVYSVIQPSLNRRPVFEDSVAIFNHKPAVKFDDTNDGMITSLTLNKPYSVVVVYNLETFPQGDARAVDGSTDWFIGPNGQIHSHYANGWVSNNAPIADADNRPVVAVATNNGFVSRYYLNGQELTSGAGIGAPMQLFLGAAGSGVDPLGGYIAEVIVYSRAISPGERKDLQTYLGTKYGIEITVPGHRFFTFDNHGNDLAGISQDSIWCWGHENSRNIDSTAILSVQRQGMNNGQYFYWGHNGSNTNESTNGVPEGIKSRLNRTWKVANYGAVDSLDFMLDVSQLNLGPLDQKAFVLLVDDDDNFASGAQMIYMSELQGDSMIFRMDSIRHGDYFTLARLDKILVDVKMNLQGPYDIVSGQMKDDLRVAGLIPATEPYSSHPTINHSGGETVEPSVLAVSGNDAIVDWVLIALRSKSDSNIVATRAALLQRDGDVVDTDGLSSVQFFGLKADTFFVSIHHRNHLGAMTQNKFALNDTTTIIDFQTTSVFGFYPQVSLSGVWALWAGNVNGDNAITFQGGSNDPSLVFLRVLSDPGNTSFARNYVVTDYSSEDVNMDGQIIFQGGNTDTAPIFTNVLAHPGNATFSRNHVIEEQLP